MDKNTPTHRHTDRHVLRQVVKREKIVRKPWWLQTGYRVQQYRHRTYSRTQRSACTRLEPSTVRLTQDSGVCVLDLHVLHEANVQPLITHR